MADTVTPKEILSSALKILKTEGWIQGELKSSKGYCAVGAIRQATFGNIIAVDNKDERYESYARAIHAIVDCSGDGYHTVPSWNDYIRRTKEDVISTFRKAIASV